MCEGFLHPIPLPALATTSQPSPHASSCQLSSTSVPSTGIFCCGPASVKAIREGEVHLPYDTPFVYAEVNADEVIWLFRDGQAQEILDHNTRSIGKEISTKMVGSAKRQNITSSYKYPEGAWGPGVSGWVDMTSVVFFPVRMVHAC